MCPRIHAIGSLRRKTPHTPSVTGLRPRRRVQTDAREPRAQRVDPPPPPATTPWGPYRPTVWQPPLAPQASPRAQGHDPNATIQQVPLLHPSIVA